MGPDHSEVMTAQDSGDDYEIQCGISDANRNEIDHLASCSRLRILFTIVGLLPVYGISPGVSQLRFASSLGLKC